MKTKKRSVGAAPRTPDAATGKALSCLMLCATLAIAAGVVGCGQKRPLQLPAKPGHAKPANTNPPTEPDILRHSADPASAPASAAIMPQR
ncbi:hypothetical protein [Roseateles amylovorans]|uniref:Lipoprotein n=1 Tax=Roseateles amylovorans TaxID=2978473 RepID=A0ABY6B1Q6_9BURK|nr:hypothetical protein [Roseateles amylovorans]UXH79335.1 hypothetical protein N4261_05205 [Roseateles amylovorans]